MKALPNIIASFFLTTALICGCGICKVNAQSTVKSVTKEEPKIVKLKITGMTCSGCSNHVATTLKSVDGVVDQKVEYPGNVATIKYNPAKTSIADIIKSIENIGYKASVVSEKTTANKS